MRLLVASHDASRTGAPLVLLTFLRWLRAEHPEVDVDLVLWRGGALVSDFEAVADTRVLHPAPGHRSRQETMELGLGEVGLGRIGTALTRLRVRRRLASLPEADRLLLNGAGSGLVLPHLRTDAPALVHVHELDRGLGLCLPGAAFAAFFDRCTGVAAVSQRVADVLVARGAVTADQVSIVPGCVPPRVDGGSDEVPAGEGPLVLAVGAGSWRKGVDLFLQVSAAVRRLRPEPTRFAWVGPLDDEAQVRAERTALGLDGVLRLPGEVTDPTPWYAASTVFCSTAREDPFPLAALEAGAAALPVVAFDNGGITELLADGRGDVVGYADVEAMARRVAEVLDGGDGGRGARLAEHVATHHTAAILGDALWRRLVALA